MKDVQTAEIFDGRYAVDVYKLRSLEPPPRVMMAVNTARKKVLQNHYILGGAVDAGGIFEGGRYGPWRAVLSIVHRPQESPGSSQIIYGAGDAGGTLRRLLGTWSFLPHPPHRPGVFKATLNVVVAEEQAFGAPGV
jgi:hypothetical protein